MCRKKRPEWVFFPKDSAAAPEHGRPPHQDRTFMDYKDQVFAELATINRLAARRFANPAVAEEAAFFVVDGLAANDWQRLRGFTGKSSFTTYLASLTYRLLEDFSRRRFGRKRPPLWIRLLGGIHALLFRFLCLDRLPLPEAVEFVAQRQRLPDRREIEAAAWTILEKVGDCRSHQGLEVAFDEADPPMAHQDSAGESLEAEDRTNFLQALFAGVFERDDGGRLARSCAGLIDLPVELSAEERLLLKMCYQDNLSVTMAGEALGLNRDQVHGRLRRLLSRLAEGFRKAGIADELRDLLG
jgi:DNA-directed RNA polymerase specialized sigma24 family protein